MCDIRARTRKAQRKTRRVEKVYGLIFMDRKEAPLSRRCSLEYYVNFNTVTPQMLPNIIREPKTLLFLWTRASGYESKVQNGAKRRSHRKVADVIKLIHVAKRISVSP